MSQYIHFFIRSTDKMLPIRTAPRSSSAYYFFSDYAPYEEVDALSMQELQSICEEIKIRIDEKERRIEEKRTELQLIASFNNSVEDKIEALEFAKNIIRENEEIVDEMKEALAFTHFLIDTYNEAAKTKYYDKDEIRIDPTKYLYFGIECGIPTIAEVEEWENSKS